MVVNSKNTPPDSIVSINGNEIKNTNAFKYLGVWISSGNLHIGNKELDYRIGLAHNAFAEIENYLHISMFPFKRDYSF